MQRACLWIISALLMSWGVFAVTDEAAAQTLKGAYGFTGTANCLVALNGFNDKQQVKMSATPPSAFGFSFSVEGIRTFNGDGTGTVNGTAVTTTGETEPLFRPNASSHNLTFNFTYVVNGDGSWTSDMVPMTYLGTFLTGPRGPLAGPPSVPAQTYTIDKLPTISGLMAVNGMTLTAAHLTPTVETHTYSNGDVEIMICHRSRVFIRLSPAP